MTEYLTNEVITRLEKEFPTGHFIKYHIEHMSQLVVFAVLFKKENELEANYMEISSFIGAYYQPKLESQFVRWNTYLIYLCKETVCRPLKFKIENNKFSNRKIVKDVFIDEFNEDSLKKIIDDRILNLITFSNHTDKQDSKKYESSSPIWTILSNINEGEQAGLSIALSKIENTLKNEN